jgi:hypothetical protein
MKLCLLITLIFSSYSFAKKPKLDRISLAFGTLTENMSGIQTSTDGETPLFSSYNPYFSLGTNLIYFDSFDLSAELSYVIRRKANDSSINKDMFFVRFSANREIPNLNWLRWHAGTSSNILIISGDGSEVMLNNGDGETEYYIPSERQVIFTQTLDLGLEALLDNISLKAFIQFVEPMDKIERTFNSTFSFHYNIPLKEL